ncbi:cellulose synthase operon protein YhjQ/BcsQ [Ruegeria marina]|uniref:AAA domain-containing protein n=1 Tax=Ruegeria marina TaxID=639004 RepID=A0A1G6VKD4_9RHOB|nr:cellulose synthase operon protein YhjQ/BcsQ [Ruegeria marina]SDD53974.1 AAA domain-containing protein [Ruegeria marina]
MIQASQIPDLHSDASRLFTDIRRNFPATRQFLVTGCNGGEGVSTLCLALGRAAHRIQNANVLLVDANFRTRGLSSLVHNMATRGLCDLPTAPTETPEQEVLRHTVEFEPGVSILPRGDSADADAIDLQSRGILDKVIAAASARFDITIWDTDAINISSDTKVLATRLPDIVLVTLSDVTRMDHLTSSLREISTMRARPIAVLRNRAGKRPFSIRANA